MYTEKQTKQKNIQQRLVTIYCYNISAYMKLRDKRQKGNSSSKQLLMCTNLSSDQFNNFNSIFIFSLNLIPRLDFLVLLAKRDSAENVQDLNGGHTTITKPYIVYADWLDSASWSNPQPYTFLHHFDRKVTPFTYLLMSTESLLIKTQVIRHLRANYAIRMCTCRGFNKV